MIISVRQENLAKALSTVGKAVESRPPLPVLANILFEATNSQLKLVATNLQMSVTMWIGANVEKTGAITLPAKTISDLINNLDAGRVDLSLDEASHTVLVRYGGTKANVKGIDADEFPPVTHSDESNIFISGRVLKEMINQTAFAAAKEDNRPILTGVYTLIEGDVITMAAADGYRLAVRYARLTEAYKERVELVIPAKTLSEVARLIDNDDEEVGIALPGKRDIVTFNMSAAHVQISTQLLEGRFPDFRAIIPKSYVTSTVMYTDDLLRACKRAEIFARDNAFSGRMHVKPSSGPGEPGAVFVMGKSAERGDNEGLVDASVEGEALEISFNISYLIEVLRVVNEERVVFQSNGAENPGVIRPENREDFVHVIMPMAR